jgi:hypothetical protein
MFLLGRSPHAPEVCTAPLTAHIIAAVGEAANRAYLVFWLLSRLFLPFSSYEVILLMSTFTVSEIALSVVRRTAIGANNYIIIFRKDLIANGAFFSQIIHSFASLTTIYNYLFYIIPLSR